MIDKAGGSPSGLVCWIIPSFARFRDHFGLPRTRCHFCPLTHLQQNSTAMLGYTILFLIIALIAGTLGFGVIAGTAATIAKVLFILFLILFVASLFRGRRA
jgi:uncharacterized membrane protein YtjA (UPF0391 family)